MEDVLSVRIVTSVFPVMKPTLNKMTLYAFKIARLGSMARMHHEHANNVLMTASNVIRMETALNAMIRLTIESSTLLLLVAKLRKDFTTIILPFA